MIVRGLSFPDDRAYWPEYMVWLQGNASGLLTLGLTPLAAATAGEILVFVGKAVGWMIEANRSVGNVETGKLVSSVRTPVAGKLVQVNHALEASAGPINTDPYGSWLVRLETRRTELVQLSDTFPKDAALRDALEQVMDDSGFFARKSRV